MEFEKKTFISSTFWTERLGYVAAFQQSIILKKTIQLNLLIKLVNI